MLLLPISTLLDYIITSPPARGCKISPTSSTTFGVEAIYGITDLATTRLQWGSSILPIFYLFFNILLIILLVPCPIGRTLIHLRATTPALSCSRLLDAFFAREPPICIPLNQIRAIHQHGQPDQTRSKRTTDSRIAYHRT